jgi:DNA recombination protein RmuC
VLQQLANISDTLQVHRTETSKLVTALRSPSTRGRWGEIQLRRVIEMAGMLNYCDFQEQTSVNSEDGLRRPDVTVRLPAGRTIVVDSKAPMTAYIDSTECTDDEERKCKLVEHAQQVRNHIKQLSQKSYWEQFEQSPEFVLLFLPGDPFYSAALEQDPSLIEYGVEQKVLIATPATLIALLKAVSYGWRQESLAQNAQKISTLGKEIHDRLFTLSEHIVSLGRSLGNSVKNYNEMVGSIESRVLVSARRFKELSVTSNNSEELKQCLPIEQQIRELRVPEFPKMNTLSDLTNGSKTHE